ncbi:response regulator transcription factor [Novosphingobium ginsenosidimutans]|uniref:Response regulator n=1 Tax=Novosphingobium ginsenosidimutans TaxID=1176536 RepID=A0A5B8S1K8_9SPHN|nr:response regulator transcription factor [Novosphingobium ginsenosidimutans]QEA14745.1 response regulator [Novosphingobium ginsenosidimutans]
MPANATVLITAPPPALLQGLRRRRPDLTVAPLEEGFPEAVPGPVWCFVDWLLPDRSGLEMVRTLREARATRDSHITMVLESPEPDDKRRALRAGADDYLVGPLSAEQLLERLATYEAKPAAPSTPRRKLAHGELVLDLNAHQVRYQGRLLVLRPNELRLLAHFLEHPDQVFSRTALIERIGKDEEVSDERTVDVWVGRLRRALVAQGAPDPLRTVRSAGYVLDSLPDTN